MKNIAYLLALHSIDGFGPIRLKSVLEFFKDPKLAWEANVDELIEAGATRPSVELLLEKRRTFNVEEYLGILENLEIKFITVFDENYPSLLKEIYDPPMVLYYKGEILPIDDKAVGVVGTRKITGYGKLVTEKFTKGLVEAGITVVSGLARGVDSAAHWTTLKNEGRTLAILGGGLNNIYPPENTGLAEQIKSGHGAIISEFPPDYPSLPGNFPSRNRIISGLSLGVLVTEATSDSGSLITARLALEQGRDVFAVPGPITSDLSKGPADLIKEGARLVLEPDEILDELGIIKTSKVLKIDLNGLSEDERKILDCLENEGKHIDEICRQLGLATAKTSATLLKMEIAGLLKNLGGGVYCRV